MGRVQGNNEPSAALWHSLPLASLIWLVFFSSGFAQVSSAPRTQNSADQQIRVENPFATPWLLSQATPPQREVKSPATAPKSDEPLPKTKYRLHPDPFNDDLRQSSSHDEVQTQDPRVSHIDTAQRPASEPAPRLRKPTAETTHLDPKYDISRIGDRGVGKKLNFYSIEKEQALGRELAQQVEQQAKLVTDPVITEYVNRIGQTLVRHSDARVPFTIKVVDDEQVNAFALPGGFFYVNTGVLLATDSEAELAGVMAHEIAHVAARHATRNATKQDIWNFASLPLIFVGGPVGAAIRQASGIVVPMSFLKFSRDSEREADFLGMEYEYAAGYDPTSFVDFFEKLEAQKRKSGFIARAFSTHPMNQDRIRRAESELEMLPERDDYIVTTSEFDQVKSRLMRLTRGRAINSGNSAHPTLRKHPVEDEHPPILRR